MASAILCRGLRKSYQGRTGRVDAVNGIDLEVGRGECFGILGPNGAGKTTTIEVLEGLLPPTSGEVFILGRRWGTDDAALRQRLGISLQETRLEEKLTARETLALFRSFYDQGHTPEEALAALGLTAKANAYVGQLSGGQRQRLAVACALIGDPELAFLDEPTTGLDPQSRRQLWDVLRRFRDRGGTVLLTTHSMDEAEQLCDRVAIIDHGRALAVGTPAELIARTGGEHVIEFALAPLTVPSPPSDGGEGTVRGTPEDAALRGLAGVVAVGRKSDGYRLTVTAAHVTLPALLEHLRDRRLTLAHLTTRTASLEDVFLTLTGQHWPAGEAMP
jgi:ABC-2 type transport system ATP-binding protein